MSEPKTTWRVEFSGDFSERWYRGDEVHGSRRSAESQCRLINEKYACKTRIIRIETRESVEEER